MNYTKLSIRGMFLQKKAQIYMQHVKKNSTFKNISNPDKTSFKKKFQLFFSSTETRQTKSFQKLISYTPISTD